jgi:uncharacterized protein (DUF2249 family)
MECAKPSGLGLYHFDARDIAKRFRHAAIFGALRALNPGETMRFYNDHDPLPLLAQIAQVFGPRVLASYLSRNRDEFIIDFTIARSQLPASGAQPQTPPPAPGWSASAS